MVKEDKYYRYIDGMLGLECQIARRKAQKKYSLKPEVMKRRAELQRKRRDENITRT